MTDLKGELASLRIDRDRPARGRRWPLLLLLPTALLLLGLYALRARQAMAGPEVSTAQASVTPPPAAQRPDRAASSLNSTNTNSGSGAAAARLG